MRELLKNNFFIFAAFLIASLAIWTLSDVFFWKDDWFFLRAFLNDESGFVIGQTFVSDVKPFFKYVMNAEFEYFGERYFLYNLFSVFLFSLWCFTLYFLFNLLLKNRNASLLISALVFINPSNFMNLHCIMQQTELLHLIFLNLFLIFLFLSFADSHLGNILISGTCLLIAHFFFPNSLLIPVLAIVGIFLFSKDVRFKILGSAIFITVFGIFLYHYHLLSSSYTLFEGEHEMNLPFAILFSIEYAGISFLRLLLITANSYPLVLSLLSGVIIIGSFLLIHLKSKSDAGIRKLNIFLFLLLIFSTGTVALAREGNQVLYYYSQLHIIPILWVIYRMTVLYFPMKMAEKIPLTLKGFMVMGYLGISLLQINYSKQFFSNRNSLNKSITERNITSVEEEEIFDEPIANEEMRKYPDAYVKFGGEDGPKALAKLLAGLKGVH